MAKIKSIPSECPQCGGEIWDNTKRPKKNPKAPDAACKDKEDCKWAGWLDKPKEVGAARAKYTWKELGGTYLMARKVAQRVWPEMDATSEELVAATATVFIQAVNGGLKVAAPSKPEPEPEYTPERPDDDDDLPF